MTFATNHSPFGDRISGIQLIVLPLLVFLMSGCNVGRYAEKVFVDESVPAKYTLAKVPILVIVKDKPDPTGLQIESEELTTAIEHEILAHQLAPLVPSAKASDLHSARLAEFSTMSPARIGKEV